MLVGGWGGLMRTLSVMRLCCCRREGPCGIWLESGQKRRPLHHGYVACAFVEIPAKVSLLRQNPSMPRAPSSKVVERQRCLRVSDVPEPRVKVLGQRG